MIRRIREKIIGVIVAVSGWVVLSAMQIKSNNNV
jgi:hypothetical protein